MFNKYILAILLGLSCTIHAEVGLYDQETPWTPLSKERALFYSALWGVVGAGFAHGAYRLCQTLKKPTDATAIVDDALCGVMILLCAKMVHHSLIQVTEGLDLYFDNDKQQIAVE